MGQQWLQIWGPFLSLCLRGGSSPATPVSFHKAWLGLVDWRPQMGSRWQYVSEWCVMDWPRIPATLLCTKLVRYHMDESIWYLMVNEKQAWLSSIRDEAVGIRLKRNQREYKENTSSTSENWLSALWTRRIGILALAQLCQSDLLL